MTVRTPSLIATATAVIALLGASGSFAAGVPAGEGEALLQQPVQASQVSRAEVRAAVLAAARSQALTSAGEIVAAPATPQAGLLERAAVRRDTASAVQAGGLVGAGEALAAGPAASRI